MTDRSGRLPCPRAVIAVLLRGHPGRENWLSMIPAWTMVVVSR
ncbi:hypothetical protein [Streptomyces sp. NPDC057623]